MWNGDHYASDSERSNTMATTVVNVKYEPFDIYIGRRLQNKFYNFDNSIWGNEYRKGRDAKTVEEAIERYAHWLATMKWLVEKLPRLRDKRLGCWCKEPGKNKPCHGDVLAVACEMEYEEARAYLANYKRQSQLELSL